MSDENEPDAFRRGGDAAQRIDKWLWCARIVKSRSLGAELAMAGAMRLTRGRTTRRIEKASIEIKAGDRLSFILGARLRILEVVSCAARRGPANEARTLYVDHSPPVEKVAVPRPVAERAKGAGRPSKKDRRAIDRLTGGD